MSPFQGTLNYKVNWYSTPEIIANKYTGTQEPLFYVLDAHHKLFSLRTKVCSTGLPQLGITRKAWEDAISTDTMLNPAIVFDLIDKQNNGFAQRTFAADVEDFMRLKGYNKEANFCKMVRNWYEAEDEAGLSATQRCIYWLDFLL